MPRVVLKSSVKYEGTRHPPGAVLDLSDDALALLPEGVILLPDDDAPPAPRPRPTEADRGERLRAAAARVEKRTDR